MKRTLLSYSVLLLVASCAAVAGTPISQTRSVDAHARIVGSGCPRHVEQHELGDRLGRRVRALQRDSQCAAREQLARQTLAQKPRTAGDQHFHVRTLRSCIMGLTRETPRDAQRRGETVEQRAEIPQIIEAFRRGAQNAQAAGFDGVELHAANGYLIDQFLQDSTNRRADDYGGPVEGRARLLIETVEALISVWGAGRVGVHLAPRGDAHDMGDSDRLGTFSYVARELGKRRIAFLCAREHLGPDRIGPQLKSAFGGVYIVNEGFTLESAEQVLAANEADGVAFGKLFIANPDLPKRFARKAPLNRWNTDTFYSGGEHGYIDYPKLEEPQSALAVG